MTHHDVFQNTTYLIHHPEYGEFIEDGNCIFYLCVPVSHPYGICCKIAAINKVTITTDLIGIVLCWHLWTSGWAFQKILKLLWQGTRLWKHVSGTGCAAWPGWVKLHRIPTLALRQERERGLEESSQGWEAEMSVLESAPASHSPSHPYSLWYSTEETETRKTPEAKRSTRSKGGRERISMIANTLKSLPAAEDCKWRKAKETQSATGK